jgi:hypothetical protein
MEFRASAEDISRMSHAHPTFAEAIKEAALAATDNQSFTRVNRKVIISKIPNSIEFGIFCFKDCK